MKEINWQRRVVHTVRKLGGYGKKWASQYTVGAPDLILCLPSTGIFVMEIKMGLMSAGSNVPDTYKFNQKINTTDKQKVELSQIEDAGGLAMVGLVWYSGPGRAWLTLHEARAERFEGSRLKDGQVPLCHWEGGDFSQFQNFEEAVMQIKERKNG